MDANKNNTVLVTGGRGFIGRTVGKLLQRAGYRVLSVDWRAPNAASDDYESGREILCDIADASQLQGVFDAERIGAIIQLAAILPTAAQRDPLRATQVNVEGSLNLLEMARRFGVRRFVFGSSLSVYGTCAPDQVVSEADRAAPEDLYGAAKLYAERLGEAYRDCHGVDFVSLRIGRVLGTGSQSASSAWRSQIFELLGTNDPAEIGLPHVQSERLLLVHVEDVAGMLVKLLLASRLEFGIYNALCESVVVGDLKRTVEGLNSRISIRLGESYAAGNPRMLDCSRLQREFGFRTLPIFEQLRRAAGR